MELSIEVGETKFTVGFDLNCENITTTVKCVGEKDGRPILLTDTVRLYGSYEDLYFNTAEECDLHILELDK